MTAQQQMRKNNHFLISCSRCGHVKVCAVFRAIGPLLSKNWDEDTRPFEPGQIASICREYISSSVISTLKEGA